MGIITGRAVVPVAPKISLLRRSTSRNGSVRIMIIGETSFAGWRIRADDMIYII